MILHKTFHMNQTVEEARERLLDVAAYRHRLIGVEQASFTGHGISHWRFRLPLGLKSWAVLTETSKSEDDAEVFKTLDGNIEAFGLITFHVIRPTLTEVDILLDYQFRSPILRLLDRVFHFGDKFLTAQLRSIKAHFEGIAPVRPQKDTQRNTDSSLPSSFSFKSMRVVNSL